MPKKHLNGSSRLEHHPGVKDILGPDIAKAFSKVLGKFPYVGTKPTFHKKGGLIKGKPKLTKRGY
tara:strand:- start:636 stop:830 length:195 start_codon:yes stop_codon:yes gene_type:complete